VRYYLVLLAALGFVYHPVWFYGLIMILIASVTDYCVKKPRLVYGVFVLYYILEQVYYQAGVFWGCLKLGYFGSYLPRFEFSYGL